MCLICCFVSIDKCNDGSRHWISLNILWGPPRKGVEARSAMSLACCLYPTRPIHTTLGVESRQRTLAFRGNELQDLPRTEILGPWTVLFQTYRIVPSSGPSSGGRRATLASRDPSVDGNSPLPASPMTTPPQAREGSGPGQWGAGAAWGTHERGSGRDNVNLRSILLAKSMKPAGSSFRYDARENPVGRGRNRLHLLDTVQRTENASFKTPSITVDVWRII